MFSITTCVCIVWKCRCPEKYSSYGSICGRYISVDAPSIAPIALSSLVHELTLSLHSFIVVHCTICYNALFMIGMHLFISLWTVATLHILLVMLGTPLSPQILCETFIIPFRTGRLIVGMDAVYFPISHHTHTRFI